MSPKVSVIIPNYNHDRFLRRRIQSVLDQTFQDFEIIYLDEASQDTSNSVVLKFLHDKRIRPFYNKTNTGVPFKQWNKGVRLAKGDYIWIAESDDYADQRLLETLVEKLDRKPNIGLAYCQSWMVDENDNKLMSWKDWTDDLDPKRWETDFENDGVDECQQYLLFKNTIPNASAVLFRRSVYEQAGYADESNKLSGDWFTWIRILLISDVAFVAAPLNYFRRHSSSVSVSSLVNSLYAKESYRVLHYIMARTTVPKRVAERACETMFDRWHQSQILDGQENYKERNLVIYKAARKADAKLHLRLLKKAIPYLLPSTEKFLDEPSFSASKQLESEVEQLQIRIAAMESSKFWQLRKIWFQVKRNLGLRVDDRELD